MAIVRLSRIAIACVLLLTAACAITDHRGNGDDNYFSAFKTFEDQNWDYRNAVEVTVDTLRDSISQNGLLLLSLRHTNGYAYSNIWLELQYPTEDSTAIDTFNIILADNLGHWRGHGSGPSWQTTDTLSCDFTLRRGASMRLRHIMRVDTLENIEQIGIVFIPDDLKQ